MSHWVNLYIFDPQKNTMAYERWLGQSGVVEALEQETSLKAIQLAPGERTWNNIKADQVIKLAEKSYVGGATPEEVSILAQKYPDTVYWWFIRDDY